VHVAMCIDLNDTLFGYGFCRCLRFCHFVLNKVVNE
jgi:hypothetical protein